MNFERFKNLLASEAFCLYPVLAGIPSMLLNFLSYSGGAEEAAHIFNGIIVLAVGAIDNGVKRRIQTRPHHRVVDSWTLFIALAITNGLHPRFEGTKQRLLNRNSHELHNRQYRVLHRILFHRSNADPYTFSQ
jgi:hypothetical protein